MCSDMAQDTLLKATINVEDINTPAHQLALAFNYGEFAIIKSQPAF